MSEENVEVSDELTPTPDIDESELQLASGPVTEHDMIGEMDEAPVSDEDVNLDDPDDDEDPDDTDDDVDLSDEGEAH